MAWVLPWLRTTLSGPSPIWWRRTWYCLYKRQGCIFADSPSPRPFCCQFERVWKIRREIPSHSQAISCQIEAEWATLAKCKQGRECCKTKWATQTTFHVSKECTVKNIQSALYPPIRGMTFPSRPTKMLSQVCQQFFLDALASLDAPYAFKLVGWSVGVVLS